MSNKRKLYVYNKNGDLIRTYIDVATGIKENKLDGNDIYRRLFIKGYAYSTKRLTKEDFGNYHDKIVKRPNRKPDYTEEQCSNKLQKYLYQRCYAYGLNEVLDIYSIYSSINKLNRSNSLPSLPICWEFCYEWIKEKIPHNDYIDFCKKYKSNV
jgi:hypothetical protein